MCSLGAVCGAAASHNQHQRQRHSHRLMCRLTLTHVVLIGAELDTGWKQLQHVERRSGECTSGLMCVVSASSLSFPSCCPLLAHYWFLPTELSSLLSFLAESVLSFHLFLFTKHIEKLVLLKWAIHQGLCKLWLCCCQSIYCIQLHVSVVLWCRESDQHSLTELSHAWVDSTL